ncbi:MFS transporter [Paraburkholderia sp. MM5482-R1]|uniref:MFS transporter n=1 Tax=unclassified Paraburkholderia TaxID=2615204 RepID=UPI003D1A1E0C
MAESRDQARHDKMPPALVAAVGAVAAMGVAWRLRDIPTAPAVSLERRLTPLGDTRVLLTLLTTWLVYAGLFLTYTYIGLTFDRATGGDARVLAGLLLLWGVAATVGNFAAGRLTDHFGSRRIINAAIAIVALDFALLPWTSASIATAAPALVVWGMCGWSLLVPQQHRLISIAPVAAPVLLGLNSTAIYIGVSMSGVIRSGHHLVRSPHPWPRRRGTHYGGIFCGRMRIPAHFATKSSTDESGARLVNRR